MKLKINWPTGIVIALLAFIVFILFFVIRVTFLPEYDHHLVSEDYYKEELNYQDEIDKLNNALALSKNITLNKTGNGLVIVFPKEFEPEKIKGVIFFKRLANSKIDFEIPINLKSNEILIKDDSLVEGRWDVKIDWSVKGVSYLFKEKITY